MAVNVLFAFDRIMYLQTLHFIRYVLLSKSLSHYGILLSALPLVLWGSTFTHFEACFCGAPSLTSKLFLLLVWNRRRVGTSSSQRGMINCIHFYYGCKIYATNDLAAHNTYYHGLIAHEHVGKFVHQNGTPWGGSSSFDMNGVNYLLCDVAGHGDDDIHKIWANLAY